MALEAKDIPGWDMSPDAQKDRYKIHYLSYRSAEEKKSDPRYAEVSKRYKEFLPRLRELLGFTPIEISALEEEAERERLLVGLRADAAPEPALAPAK